MRCIALSERAGVPDLMHRFGLFGRKSPVIALLCLILYVGHPAVASAANSAPVISGSPPTLATVGKSYGFTPTASDPDGQTLRFSIKYKPAWATFSTTTGRLSGTAPISSTWSGITISVSDGLVSKSLPAFSIKASTANRPPVIGGTPSVSVNVGQTYAFTPKASDPEGQTLTFRIANKPAWATFSTSTGTLRGTPTSAQVGTYSNIVIGVSDGTQGVSLAGISIAVKSTATVTNRAPVISGTPVTSAMVGQPYAFKPTVYDADGGPLTFSITNKPAWAKFDSSNGTLYGVPTGTGTFSGIVITVSDGKAAASLAAYAVTVSPSKTTSVTLSWIAPKTNTDGTPLVGLAGFRILYGIAPGQYSQSLSIANSLVRSAVLQGLGSGYTWYFTVTAIGSGGVESAYATEVSKKLL